ncbi:hypothetical protein [Streptomyces chartreusis]|uniref:hypothetical protein n=1 Tax=Streptomyces chartreusis TaxID=1969 RepID=UPI0036813B92
MHQWHDDCIMPGMGRDGRGEGEQGVRQARLATMREIRALQAELQEIFDELAQCEDDDAERVWELLHAAGTMTGVWMDDIACRFAGIEEDADEVFAHAWRLLDDLAMKPAGFTTRTDPLLFATLRRTTSGLLARLWVTGFLLAPVPIHAWPNTEIAALLLTALEHHADAADLAQDLFDHPRHDGPEDLGEQQP